jgi:putative membrane protein
VLVIVGARSRLVRDLRLWHPMAQALGKRGGGGVMMDGWDWYWGALMMVLVWGALAVVIAVAVRASSSGSRRGSRETGDAQTILETRFAKGEISQEEFEERKKVLRSRV